jgi:threonine dehydrogenase-like Zn-dependent dehydrogenase
MVWKPRTAVVTGTGTIGLLAILLLKLRGLDVAAVDRSDYHKVKTPLFEMLGVKHFNSKGIAIRDLPKKMKKNIDVVIEATGNSSVALESMHIIGSNGVVCLTSVTGGSNVVEICADCLNLELVLGNKVVFGTVNANREYFERGVKDMVEIEKRHPGLLQKIITAKVPFKDFDKALELLSGKSEIKIVVEVNKE